MSVLIISDPAGQPSQQWPEAPVEERSARCDFAPVDASAKKLVGQARAVRV
jgi:hypothetical protein